jgi:hypothetical protein
VAVAEDVEAVPRPEVATNRKFKQQNHFRWSDEQAAEVAAQLDPSLKLTNHRKCLYQK